MSEKKYLDCRIEWDICNFSTEDIAKFLNEESDIKFTVTPLPELASEEEITKKIWEWNQEVGVSRDLTPELCLKIARHLLGKVALPSPEPEKWCECRINPKEDFSVGVHPGHCKYCGLPIKETPKPPEKKELPEKLSEEESYIKHEKEVVAHLAKSEPEKCILHPEGGCDCDKPPEKKELPEKLSFISGLTEFQDTINALIDIIREMREAK
uniref:Uncharacterized protein n=1 Tax=viral metagenome TaxID=1070528 RepID=A0A6M3IVS5_9ZZZZ